MDRLWIGYITGSSFAAGVAVVNEAVGLPVWQAMLIFLALTPIGIYLARYLRA